MKKVFLLVLLSISVGSLYAQLQEKLGVKTVIGASASQYNNLNLQLNQSRAGVSGSFQIKSVGIQVGLPYMGVIDVPFSNNPSQYYKMDLGFPWGIRYRYSTFAEDAFTVSKGYYTDKVSINWGIKNNASLITSFLIYRSSDITSSNPDWGSPIVTLASSARSYDDNNTEGGKLYRYKVTAIGVESVQSIYSSYIIGIGYRNPTAVITGNVSFSAGNPVKNVLISATPTGSILNFGTSLRIPGNTYASVNRLHKVLNDSLTLQAWVKPETNFNNDAITIYEIKSNVGQSKYFKVKLGVVNNRNTLTLTIEEPYLGDHIITLSDYIPNGEVDNKGADVLVPISNVNGTFTHFTAVLRNNVVPEIYINGRLINASYADQMNTILANNATSGTTPPTVIFSSTNTATRLNTSPGGYPQSWTQFNLGGGKTSFIDECRVWETALTPSQVLTDYRRYLKGNESYLHTYLTANEGAGDYAYDLSSTGFNFHGNDAKLNNSSNAQTNGSNPPTSIIQNGLVVNLDPGQTSSYPGTGNVWTNTGTGGSAYNATLQNSPTFSSNYGGSFSFNGTNQGTQIPRPVQDDFTLSAWFKTASAAGDLYGFYSGIGIIDGEAPGSVNDYGITMGNGKLIFGTGNPDVNIFSSNTYNDNKWHNVVCTRVKSTGAMVMYVDGVQIGTATGNTNSLNVPNNLTIGVSQLGKYFPGSISVINIYNNALTASQVQQNYNYFYTRYAEPSTTFSNITPTSSQLGILGVTDQYGNFVISAVPYTGNGNSYTLVPSLGKHQFNPKQQLVYVGVGSTVINNVNFKDISSFTFNGLATYDSRGVFPTTSDAAIRGDIKENESYNAYTVGNQKYQKGQYWAFKNANGGIDSLRRYAVIPVPSANVYIDNQPAIDANNVPVMTDINGRFSIQVPIGQHAITLVKNGHTFLYDGRYPANTSTVVNGQTVVNNTYQDFYQDQIEPITFIDTTKVIVIGRVVGGSVQAGQTIGFGDTGKKTYNYTDAAGVSQSTVYTSINNIGVAKLTLGYMPVGANSVTPEYKTSFQTNTETGEFRVKLLPLSYSLSQNDLIFLSGKNPGNKPLLDQDKTLNYTNINPLQTPTFNQGTTNINGAPYQEVLKYTYFANPSFSVLSQTSDAQITADGNTYTIASDQPTPVYSQFGNYQINIQAQETYFNYDRNVSSPVISTVPVSGGQLIATNNLALQNTDSVQVSSTDSSVLIYSFRGGIPNTDSTSGYKRTINLLYRLNGVDYPITNYKSEGILLGGVSDGTQTFVTAGPQIPDFVLRDPPGANSSATIDKGSSFTFSKESTFRTNIGVERTNFIHAGFENSVGGSVTGPVVKTDIFADNTTGLSMSQSSSNGISLENTYTFDQSISTSSDPGWDGSDADLYIGYSANQYYGTYNDLTSSVTPNSSSPIKVVPLSGSNVNFVYPKINSAIYFNESPQKTFFIYSQRSILNDLIPKYQNIINQIDSGLIQQNTSGVLSRKSYVNSINLWRKIILNNELTKYYAFNKKDSLKVALNNIINGLKDPVTKTYSASAKNLINVLNATFFQNISFDAGVGSITKSYQVDKVSSNSFSYDLDIDASVAIKAGYTLNNNGFEVESVAKMNTGVGTAGSNQNANTTNVSFTLQDNNAGNLLSVDVINPFDGNGPIFITKGGQTSCPYEGAELTHFYNPNHPNVTDPKPTIVDLNDSDRVPLSLATVALERPEITVVSSNVTGVYDGRNAEFVLKLRNTSIVKMDATFMLMVDQTTNPDNALINISPNGTIVNIPAGQTVTFTMTLKKVKQDQFDYRNIKVALQSLCDGNATSSVSVSASFVPACSPVTVIAPSNNWLLNRNTAYDGSITKPLNITIGGYSTSFTSFQKINLEYRLQGTPNWTGLRTYYKNAADTATAIQGGDNKVELINGNQLNYAWDIAKLRLSNGAYEIRARSTCYNNTAFESPIILGTVNLDAPVVFGTPTPTNGILGIGDDITVRFNKPIKINGTVSMFEFLVQQNQSPVNHQVSLSFNGVSNTATLNKPYITTGDLSIEFWMKNASPAGTSTLLSQSGGLKVELIDNLLKYTLGGQSISATILKDGNYNHYTLSYNSAIPRLSIIENDRELSSTTSPNPITTLSFTNSNPIVIGGSSFKGNIHDLRLWSKPLTRDQSVANMNVALTGSENGILGVWPMNEGNGKIAKDLARFKSLDILNANWDIFPKGTAYDFTGTNYLSTNSNTFSKVIISKEMDATVSFWMKTAQSNATIVSNGKGDSTDFVESNQFRNKWAFNTNANGGLELAAEGYIYPFGNIRVNDNSWHHVAVSLTRNGGLQLYVDGNQLGSYATTNIGGLASTSLFIGARGKVNTPTNIIDRYFVGQVDELCIWNMARTADQIKSDMYFEQNYTSNGLLFYANFNKPDVANSNGPKYFYPLDAFSQTSDYALLNGQALSFTDFTPAIKPYRPTESITVNPVINNDQIVLVPEIANWASIEGKVAYITVSNLNDMYDNRQVSPVTWSALINKNPIKMFVEGQGDAANFVKTTDSALTFQITIVNQGGLPQPYSFNVPSWLTLSSTSGTIEANKSTTISATVDMNLAPGIYNNIISLTTNYGIDKKLPLNLRVLVKEPVLNFTPANYTQSMNIVGKIKINGVLANDVYDKVYAVGPGGSGLEMRGKAGLTYDKQLNTYNVFLTVYSNVVSGENINFFIWDATQGNFLEATLDSAISVPFIADRIIGNYTTPSIFENTNVAGQVVNLNQGWTWVSFNVNDPRFSSLNNLTAGANLNTSDLIQSNAPALFDSYQFYSAGSTNNGWSGGITSNGGITNNKMYKFKLANANQIKLKGVPADLNTWSFNLQTGWNWLPFVVNKNIPLGDALANLNPSEGDLIKSQNLFSIYSSVAHAWKGSLTYLNQTEGYMINVAKAQALTYPTYLNKVSSTPPYVQLIGENQIKVNGGNNATTGVVMNDISKATPTISADYSKFASNMNAIVKLPDGFNELKFYNDAGELRGDTKTINVEGKDLAFITLYGDKSENLTAYIGSNGIAQATTKVLNFTTDAILGTIASPILIELPKQEISIFPNPFHDVLKVAINSKEKAEAKIIIYNMVTSQTYYANTFNLNFGTNILKLLPNVPTGSYVIKIQIGNNVVINKIIKD